MDHFELVSPFEPMGDQPQAIEELTQGLKKGYMEQTLLGATGSGKTFTMAKVIEKVNRPTFSRRMQLSILFLITTIISPRRISRRRIPILKRTRR